MDRLSALIFSRDDATAASELIADLEKVVDEIVVIDSSSYSQRKRMERLCRSHPKAKLHWAVALGYPDPLRMYGLHKCTGNWVLLIDTDERMSGALKDDIRDIIDTRNASAFAIRRSEPMVEGERPRLYTWQIRLFRKDSVEFTGLVHEQARVKGRLARLDGGMYTLQHLRGSGGKSPMEYSRMAMFERMSYSDYNEKIADYISKLSMSEDGSSESAASHIVRGLMLGYERLLGRDMEAEISDLDYMWYFTMRNLAYGVIRREGDRVINAAADAHAELEQIRRFRQDDRSGEAFEISKMVNRVGIIRFLGLDRDGNVDALNRRYRGSAQGIELLQRLLVAQYRRAKGKRVE